MMASWFAVASAALLALAFCAAVGLPLALRLVPDRALALGVAPTLGWACFSAALLPVTCLVGFGPLVIGAVAIAALGAGVVALARRDAPFRLNAFGAAGVPALAYLAAALLATIPVLALLPSETAEGVRLAAPIFDHSKVAIVDEIARNGTPAQNPFYGATGAPSGLAYYYLWHFGAAALSLLPGVSGWEADAGLTWFTAFATLTLVMGLAVSVSGRRSAAFWALALSATASARPLVSAVFGQATFGTWLSDYPDLGTTLVQATWAPQHVAAAGAVMVALMLIGRLGQTNDRLTPVALGLVAAAGFGSSVWVGGVTFGVAAATLGVLILIRPETRRGPLVARVLTALAVAAIAASPILLEQARAAMQRPEGVPIAFHPFEVLGPSVPDAVRRPLDLVAFWLIQLPIDLPAIFPAGVVALGLAWRSRTKPDAIGLAAISAVAVLASFGVSWLLISTVLNNDLGWRAILPGVLALTGYAAAGLARWTARPANAAGSLAAIALLLAGLHGGLAFLKADVTARPAASAKIFAQSPALWAAVRRHAGPTERIANNPASFADVTPWPINISWALLSDRRSCYAGWEFVRPFAPLPRAEAERLDSQVREIFAGAAPQDAMDRFFADHDCALAVVTAADGAWAAGSFDRNPDFEPLEEQVGAWRIYRFRPQSEAPR